MIWLPPAFFATALLYASVGFGGGSTYNALLSLAQFDYRLLPIVSLACNVVVVSGSTARFARAGVVPWRRALLLALIAAPLALLGGLTPIKQSTFLVLLGLSLIAAGLALFVPRAAEAEAEPLPLAKWMPLAVAPLGYLAGLVGIGGGIFLAPLLHFTRWGQCPRDCRDHQPVHPDQFTVGPGRSVEQSRRTRAVRDRAERHFAAAHCGGARWPAR